MTRIWELRDRRLTAFRGDYSAYHRQREERDARAVKDVETQAESIAREHELVQRYRSHRKFARCTSTRRASSGSRPSGARPRRRAGGWRSRPPRSPAPGRPGRARSSSASRTSPSATCRAAARSTADGSPATEPQVVARAPFLAAQRGERIGIVGPNGAGKTTLLRTIAGELPPLDGTLDVRERGPDRLPGPAARRGDPGRDRARRADRGDPGHRGRGALRTWPASCSAATTRSRRSGSLSGGERSRLELALLGIQPSNLLLLDEPTNHLDIPAREAIEAFMAGSPATLLVVSHDRRLLETVCEKLWVVDDGAAAPFDGGYRAWRTAVAERLDGRGRARSRGEAAPRRPADRAPAGTALPRPAAPRLTDAVRARRGRRRRGDRATKPTRPEAARSSRRTRIGGSRRRSTGS